MISRRLPGGDLWKYYLGFAFARLGTVIVLVIAAQLLGPERYGHFEVAVSVMLAAMIVGDAGVGAAVVRFADELREDGSVLRGALQVQLAACLVAFAVCLAPMLVLAPPDAAAAVVVLALAAFSLVEGLGVLGAGLLRARGDNAGYLKLAAVRLLTGAGVGAAGAELGGTGGALFGVALAGLGFAVAALVSALRARPGGDPGAARRRLMAYSLPLMLGTLGTWTLSLSDRVFLRVFSTPLELGQYAASYRTGSVVALFVAAPLAMAWLPVARAARERGTLGPTAARWSAALAWCSLGTGAVLVMASEEVVPLVFGGGFDTRPGVVAAVVASGWLYGLYFLVATDVMLDTSTRRAIPVMLGVVAVNLVLNALLIPPHDGAGAAVATLASYAAMPLLTALAVPREGLRWAVSPAHAGVVAALLAALALALLEPLAAPVAMAAALVPTAALRRRR